MADNSQLTFDAAASGAQLAGLPLRTPGQAAPESDKPDAGYLKNIGAAVQSGALDAYNQWRSLGDAYNEKGNLLTAEETKARTPGVQWFPGLTQGEADRQYQFSQMMAWRDKYAAPTTSEGLVDDIASLPVSFLSPTGLASAAAFEATGPLALASFASKSLVGGAARFAVQNAAAGSVGLLVGDAEQRQAYGTSPERTGLETAQQALGLTPENLLFAGVLHAAGSFAGRVRKPGEVPQAEPVATIPADVPAPPPTVAVEPRQIEPPTVQTSKLFGDYEGGLPGFVRDVHDGLPEADAHAQSVGIDLTPLRGMLNERDGEIPAVPDGLPKTSGTELVAKPDAELATFVRSGDVNGALDHLVDSGPSASYSAIASRLKEVLAPHVESGDVTLRQSTRAEAARANGTTDVALFDNGRATSAVRVALRGGGAAPRTVLHEFVHAATVHVMTRVEHGLEKNPRVVAAVGRFSAFFDKAKEQLQGSSDNHVRAALRNSRELMAYGMTDPAVQDALRGIRTGSESGFSRFTNHVREMLGMPPKSADALGELIQHFDALTRPKLGAIPLSDMLRALDAGRVLGADAKASKNPRIPPELKPEPEPEAPAEGEITVVSQEEKDEKTRQEAHEARVKQQADLLDTGSKDALEAARNLLGEITAPPSGSTKTVSADALLRSLRAKGDALSQKISDAATDWRVSGEHPNQLGEEIHKALGGEHTDSVQARDLAQQVRELSDAWKTRADAAGLPSGYLENHIAQTHVFARIAKQKAQWVQDMRAWLDPKEHPNPEQTAEYLYARLQENPALTYDDRAELHDTGVRGIHFASPEFARAYATQYGLGSIHEIVHQQLTKQAHDVAVAETLGTKPNELLAAGAKQVRDRIDAERNSGKLSRADAATAEDHLRSAELAAKTMFVPRDQDINPTQVAYTRAAVRMGTSFLSGSVALVHGFVDSVLLPANIAARGGGYIGSAVQAVKALRDTIGDEAVREKLRQQGIFTTSFTSSMSQYFYDTAQAARAGEAEPGIQRARRVENAANRTGAFISKVSLANAVRTNLEGAAYLTTTRTLASHLGTDWENLGVLQKFLENNGFERSTWNSLRDAAQLDSDTGGVDTSKLSGNLRNLVQGYLKRDADLKLNHGQLYDRIHSAGFKLKNGVSSGVASEVLSGAAAFTEWPQVFWRNSVQGSVATNGGWNSTGGKLAAGRVLGSMLVGQLLYRQAQAVLYTGQPYALDNKEYWAKALASLALGGVLGEQVGTPLAEAALGVRSNAQGASGALGAVPGLGFALNPLTHIAKATDDLWRGDAGKAAFEGLRAGQSALPNIFWTRPLLNYAVESASETLNPEYKARKERERAQMAEGMLH